MEDNIKNIDLLLDSMLKESMKVQISDEFPDKLIKEIELRKTFQEQDIKTDIMAKRVTLTVIGIISAVAFLIIFLFNTDPEKSSQAETLDTSLIYKIMSYLGSGIIDLLSSLIPSGTSFVLIVGLLLLLVLIPIADRYLINRRSV